MIGVGLSIDAIVSTGQFAGQGIHRSGVLVGNVCIKQALAYGQYANQNEVEGWDAVKDTDDARLFAPVLAYAPDYSWVAMPLCEPLGWDDLSEVPDGVDAVPYGGCYYVDPAFIAWLESSDGRRAGALTSDLHMFNVMRAPDGSIVVTDYGMGLHSDALADPDAQEDPNCYSEPIWEGEDDYNDDPYAECPCSDCERYRQADAGEPSEVW